MKTDFGNARDLTVGNWPDPLPFFIPEWWFLRYFCILCFTLAAKSDKVMGPSRKWGIGFSVLTMEARK
jgi:hypothetical protein